LLIIFYCIPNCSLQIKDGVMKKKDFDHILATPDMKQEVLGLRGP
jgi:ribosomal protein L1